MTTSSETVVNKPLSGTEIKEIMRADFDRLLDGEGMLNAYVAYRRLAYTLTLQLHTDNPMRLESEVRLSSKPQADAPGIESPPLTSPSAESTVAGTRLDRNITSPNEERLRHGLTLPVITRQPDGTTQTEQIKYPPQPELGAGQITQTDASAETREAWKVTTPTA